MYRQYLMHSIYVVMTVEMIIGALSFLKTSTVCLVCQLQLIDMCISASFITDSCLYNRIISESTKKPVFFESTT